MISDTLNLLVSDLFWCSYKQISVSPVASPLYTRSRQQRVCNTPHHHNVPPNRYQVGRHLCADQDGGYKAIPPLKRASAPTTPAKTPNLFVDVSHSSSCSFSILASIVIFRVIVFQFRGTWSVDRRLVLRYPFSGSTIAIFFVFHHHGILVVIMQ